MRILLPLILGFLILPGPTLAAALEQPRAEAEPAEDVPAAYTDLYCGLWSVFVAGQILGRPVSFLELLDGGWVDGRGSTLEQIQEAAAWAGLETDPVQHWTTLDLRRSPHPVVLHARGALGAKEYDHWLLYVGEKNGRAVLADGPRNLVEMSFSSLSSQWDGIGLVLRQDAAFPALALGKWLLGTTLILVAVLTTMTVRRLSPWKGHPVPAREGASCSARAFARQSLAFMAVPVAALGLGLGQNWGLKSGMFHQGDVVAAIQRTHLTGFLPRVSLSDVRKIVSDRLSDGQVVLIDARPLNQFEAGHIPGAIILPATGFTATDIEQLPDKQVPIVVYCSAPACGYDDEIAAFLVERGYLDVSLFPGGMREWAKAGLPIGTGVVND